MATQPDSLVFLAPQAKRFPHSPSDPPQAHAPKKKQRRSVPTAWNADVIDHLHLNAGVYPVEHSCCVCIQIDTEAYERANLDQDEMQAYELIPGKYFRIGEVDGYGVYRQEARSSDTSPNCRELFLNYKPDPTSPGWYVSSNLFYDDDTLIVAWAPAIGYAPPRQFHIPYFSQTCNPDCTLVTFQEWAEAKIVQLTDEREEPSSSKPKTSHAGSSTSGRAGWMNRMIKFIRAYRKQDWKTTDSLIEEFAEMSLIAKI